MTATSDRSTRRPTGWRRWMRRLRKLAVVGGLSVALLIVGASIIVAIGARGRVATDPAALEPTDIALVPGSRVYPDGRPSSALQDRLDTAIDLYQQGQVSHILVSGDNRRSHYNEPEAMQIYLTDRGVAARDVTLDYAGFDTWDTCLRSTEQFGVDNAVVVTQDRYANRTAALCTAAGLDVQILAIEEPNYRTSALWLAVIRERLAAVKAVGDIVRHPNAHHGGPFVGLTGSDNLELETYPDR